MGNKNNRKIIENSELVIFDFFNTIIISDNGELRLRKGAFDLLVKLKLKGKKIAVSSSSSLEELSQVFGIPEILGIRPFIDCVYGKEHVFEEDKKKYKDLNKICSDFSIKPEKSVLIGDNYKSVDSISAERYGASFIEIPSNNPRYNLLTILSETSFKQTLIRCFFFWFLLN